MHLEHCYLQHTFGERRWLIIWFLHYRCTYQKNILAREYDYFYEDLSILNFKKRKENHCGFRMTLLAYVRDPHVFLSLHYSGVRINGIRRLELDIYLSK